RIRAVATKEKPVKIREPLFERCKALAVTPTFALEYGRRFIGAVEVEIDIVTGATEARGAGAWIAFTAKPKLAVSVDKLALNAIALPAMASSAAHCRPRISASASLARVKFTMSENVPSVRFSRYILGTPVPGTMAT